jgi:hypothetical protein
MVAMIMEYSSLIKKISKEHYWFTGRLTYNTNNILIKMYKGSRKSLIRFYKLVPLATS